MRRPSIHLAQNVKQQTRIPFLVRTAVGQVLVKVCLHWNYRDQWTQHLGTTCHCTLKLELTGEENRTMKMILYRAGLSVCQPVVEQMPALIKVIHLTCRINCVKTTEVTIHIFIVMSKNSYCMFMYLHRASWHSSAILTGVFLCFFLSCKANSRVKPAKMGHSPHSSIFVLFYVLFIYVILCIVCV